MNKALAVLAVFVAFIVGSVLTVFWNGALIYFASWVVAEAFGVGQLTWPQSFALGVVTALVLATIGRRRT